MFKLLVLFFLSFSVVQASSVQSSDHPLKVVVTFSVLADLVKQVGGNRVEIHSLVGWGEDPHVFRPRPADLRNIVQADLLVTNGLGYEGWLDRLVLAAKFQGLTQVASEGVDVIRFTDEARHDAHDGEVDPHAWLSISAVKVYVENISDALGEVDPQGRDLYERNAKKYLAQLDALDDFARQKLLGIPEAKRHIVVPHNSFAYLARDYGFHIHSLRGLSTKAQASAAQIAQVIRQIRKLSIHAVFSENITNSRLIDQVRNETGVVIAGDLVSGALSADIAPTYLKMMEHNINTIVRALRGD